MKKVLVIIFTLLNTIVMNGQNNQMELTLNNGVQMPQFGLGVYSIPAGDVTYNSVLTALKAGYRHIDTAHAYQNERSVGQAVKDSGIDRDSIWITSKLWPNEYGEGKTLKAIDRMLNRLGLKYIDLVYFHQSMGDYTGGWKEMEKAMTFHNRTILTENFKQTNKKKKQKEIRTSHHHKILLYIQIACNIRQNPRHTQTNR